MSIDFDGAALQTQQDEDEYDQEDYAREQELHKLLTDLPDDMLEDSCDSSSPELDYATCSNGKNNSPQAQQSEWSSRPVTTSHKENVGVDYKQDSDHGGYLYRGEALQIGGHSCHPQSQHPIHVWNQQLQDCQFNQRGNTYTSAVPETSRETNDFSTEAYEPEPYTRVTKSPVDYDRERGPEDQESYEELKNAKRHFQNFEYPEQRRVDHYKASYIPLQSACQPKTFSSQGHHQEAHFDHLQKEFLDIAQNTADSQQLAQLQILNKAQKREIEDLEQKLEDSRRNMRYLEHQFAVVKDEKDGLAVSLKECNQLVEEAKEREFQMQNKVKSMEQQVHALTERDHENIKKQRIADAAVDSMKQQMMELCRSDTLSRAREQHDRDLSIMKEQHELVLLALEQKLDSSCQALKEQTELSQRLREQVKQLEHQREEEQMEKAKVINILAQRLEDSQQQCAKLLQTGSVQEMAQMQIKLEQALSAKALSENTNKVLQEDLADLKGQITLYESAVKHGVIALDLNADWDNQLSESYMDLGIKKTNRKNGRLHSTVLADLADPKLPKEEALQELKAEMQRCLASLRGKRQKINQLQEELQLSQTRAEELRTQLDKAHFPSDVRNTTCTTTLDCTQEMTGVSQKELTRLQEDKQHLEAQLEVLEENNKELRQSQEKLRSANKDLCTKMREMIQELDQEKQEAAERYERIQQQYRDDVVKRVRTELTLERDAQIDQLAAQHQQQIQQLETQLSEASDKMVAVQECYIAVCKEKDMLDERLHRGEKEEALMKENEMKMREESSAAMEKLRTALEMQHQASVNQLKVLWSKEKDIEIQQQVKFQVALVKATCKEELEKMERTWTQRLEEARKMADIDTAEESSQTDESKANCVTVTLEELESRLTSQKERLQLEAHRAKARAVEETRKQIQSELQEKHLEDMTKQVEGAVTRAYSRWVEDLTSLPEYKANLQREEEKWKELQENNVQQQVSQALRLAEEKWHKRHRDPLVEQWVEAQRMDELQKQVASLQNQLEQVRGQQAALLRAELAGARATWNRDKQQELSAIQVRSEQECHAKLQEKDRKLQQALQQTREESELKKKELCLQMETERQQALRAREEEWSAQQAKKEQDQRKQIREEFLVELQAGLEELQAQLLGDANTEKQNTEGAMTLNGTTAEIAHIIRSSCKDVLTKAVYQAKKEWKKMSEEKLCCVLKETQEQHEREIVKMQSYVSQKREEARCGKQCAGTISRLQKKNQDLQRHLEKACRKLQQTVKENKAALQCLQDEHKGSLRKIKEDHLLQLEEVKRSSESMGSNCQQSLQNGLEEMKQQYLTAVEKIRGDMLRYLQESRERAGEMICDEMQRERRDTARKLRRYYLTCLRELQEDGVDTTRAENKIMNAAGKMEAMAKVLEAPVKRRSGKNHSLPSSSTAVSVSCSTSGRKAGLPKHVFTVIQTPERSDEWTCREKSYFRPDPQMPTGVKKKPLNKAAHQDMCMSGEEEASKEARLKTPGSAPAPLFSYKPPHQMAATPQVDLAYMSVRCKSRVGYLQGVDSNKADHILNSDSLSKALLVQEPAVRDEGQAGSSEVSQSSNVACMIPDSERRVEPVRPFSPYAASPRDLGEFMSLTQDTSDVTAYNEIPMVPTHTKTLTFATTKRTRHREHAPCSEGMQNRVGSQSVFVELRQCQQDSGFNSPFVQQ
ncbi:centrosomal protein of 152 kDa [Lampris incognitus]|uniref:centrosomal protein of 152 kDa n=1 Tax=Lampris incognitus TaxID=2546036 RepID=UPI0024B5F369|nr:centrosomal protein of 152 kDa [Lampris incognitus]